MEPFTLTSQQVRPMAKRNAKLMGENEFENELTEDIAEFYDDPLGFVMYAFNWGEGDLKEYDGPDLWQAQQLIEVGEEFVKDPETTIREAIASGHGIGKSTEVSWIILWAMSTRPHLNAVITANTTTQLSTKTWRELALWHKRAINHHWFTWTATKFFHKQHPETWFAAAIPNTEHNAEAFAGLHAEHVLIIYDEASGIPDVIWEVTEGAMTTPKAMWFVFGNPTRNTGRFKSCFEDDAARWRGRQIDSRTCKMTNKKELQELIDTYGEDSDFVRVRIKGQFPRAGSMQFIANDVVDFAMLNTLELEVHISMPVVLGVDIARYGDDQNVVAVRQGRKILELVKWRETDLMESARRVAVVIQNYQPQATFVDGVGIGAGVVDRLRQLSYDVIEVNAGTTPTDDELFFNKRAEMWYRMREWLQNGADIPKDPQLRKALIGIEYGFDDKDKYRLERKQDMKKRGEASPDEGDAIAHTFAENLGDQFVQSFEPEDSFEPEAA